MRGRGLSPHHLLPRPARRDGDLHRHAARREGALPGAAVQRQSDRRGRTARRPPLRHLARPAQKAQLPVRAGGRQAGGARAAHRHPVGQRTPAAGLRAPGRPRQDRARDELADPLGAVGRGALWPAAGSGALHGGGHQRLQRGRDGEQGPEHLQHQVRACQALDGDRQRLRRGGKRDRPRVLPQLDGQPRHLPRLVPAQPERGPDGVPRPGIQHGPGRHAERARGQAHRKRHRPAQRAVPRRRRPHGAPGAA